MKLAVITGDTGTLGSALVQAFLAHDFRVIGLSRKQASPSEPRYTHLVHDITKDPGTFIAELVAKEGTPTTFINNAGAFLNKPIRDTADEELSRLLEVNFVAIFKIMRALLPHYARAGLLSNTIANRSILNVGSAAMFPEIIELDGRDIAAYAAAKAALAACSVAAAKEMAGVGVRVNVLAPRYFSNNPARIQHVVDQCLGAALGRAQGTIIA